VAALILLLISFCISFSLRPEEAMLVLLFELPPELPELCETTTGSLPKPVDGFALPLATAVC